jgi:hypothetical protein
LQESADAIRLITGAAGSGVGVLGVTGGGIDEMDGSPGLVDEVAYATSCGDLVLPLWVYAAA